MLIVTGQPIISQNTVVDIEPTIKFGQKSDTASINSYIILKNDGQEQLEIPITIFTVDPNENQPPDPVARLRKDPVRLDQVEVTTLDFVTMAQVAGPDQAQNLKSYLEKAADKATRAYKGVVPIAPQSYACLRYYVRERIRPDETGLFVFETIAPLPQFALVTHGSVSVVMAAPRSLPDFPELKLIVTELRPEPTENLTPVTPIADRQIFGWHWRQDPILRVSYRYQM